MAAPDFDLLAEPNPLAIRPDQSAEASLILQNPTKEPLLFKVKCTDNKKFRIRPSMGLMEGNGSAIVNIERIIKHDPSQDECDQLGIAWAFPPDVAQSAAVQWKLKPASKEKRYAIVSTSS